VTTLSRRRPWRAFLAINRVVVASLLTATMMLSQSLGMGPAAAQPGGRNVGLDIANTPGAALEGPSTCGGSYCAELLT
jgi:hypothetical protein